MVQELDSFEVPAGTIVKIDGFPFELAAPTVLRGREANFQLALSQREASVAIPDQAIGSDVMSTTSNLDD